MRGGLSGNVAEEVFCIKSAPVSVCLPNAGIVHKRMDLSSHFSDDLLGHDSSFYSSTAVTKYQREPSRFGC